MVKNTSIQWNEMKVNASAHCSAKYQGVYIKRRGEQGRGHKNQIQQAESDNIQHKNQIQKVRLFPMLGTTDPMLETKFPMSGAGFSCWEPLQTQYTGVDS